MTIERTWEIAEGDRVLVTIRNSETEAKKSFYITWRRDRHIVKLFEEIEREVNLDAQVPDA